jgi:peroxiredoxin
MAVNPSVGWGVLHLFLHVDRAQAAADPLGAKAVLDTLDAFAADDHQVLVGSGLGHKADVVVMALGPDLQRLQQLQNDIVRGPFTLTSSFLSLTELSPYTSNADDERARLTNEEGLTDAAEIESRLAVWSDRMDHYQEQRIHPKLPRKNVICFYPMLKRRTGDDNWYSLPFADRKRLMGGHARTGRSYAGRVLQLITGATGMDDWEWGVTLLADDPVVIKDIVHEMRFDEVGPFVIALLDEPAAVLHAVGLTVAD